MSMSRLNLLGGGQLHVMIVFYSDSCAVSAANDPPTATRLPGLWVYLKPFTLTCTLPADMCWAADRAGGRAPHTPINYFGSALFSSPTDEVHRCPPPPHRASESPVER